MSNLSFAADAAGFAGLRPQYEEPVSRVESSELQLIRALRHLLAEIDTSDRTTWPFVIQAARRAGVGDEDLRRELGASPSTVHRWVKEGVAPREGTRRLMKIALLSLIDLRIAETGPRIVQDD